MLQRLKSITLPDNDHDLASFPKLPEFLLTQSEEITQRQQQLEDYLILTLNKAIQNATNVNETELAAVAKDGMPNIPGMDSLFK